MHLGLGLPLSAQQGGGAPAFDPASLFASGEEGAWFEPSPTTAFQSTTNLTPCAAGDPCGFLLDKSQGAGYSGGSFTGLAAELVTNGGFDTDTDWTKGTAWVISGGTASNNGSSGYTQIEQDVGAVGGRGYQVTFTVTSGTIADVRLGGATSAFSIKGGVTLTAGTYSFIGVTAAGSNALLYFTAVNAVAGAIDNVSVRELPGNHATQATAAARPTLQQTAGGLYYLDFDGVDDWLLATDIGITVNAAWEVVWGASQGSTGRFFWSMGGVADAVRNGGGSDLRWGATTSIASLTGSDTVFGVSAAVAGSNDLTGYVNGAAQTTITRPSSVSADMNLAISSAQTFQFNSGSDANFFGGIWINRQLTAQERADTVEYLAARTGVTL